MSLIPGNVEILAFGIQTDKSTPASVPVIAVALEDCQLDPGVQFVTPAETDQNALEPDDVIVGAGPGGTFKKYVRPSEEDFFLAALLGKNVDAGTTPKTHTATLDPAAPFNSPYLTVWDIWPGVATVQYVGMRLAQGVYTAQAGGIWEAEYTLVGRQALMHQTQPTLTGLQIDELPFTWPELTCQLGGSSDAGIVNQASLTIARNTKPFVGDNGLVVLDIPNGLASVSGSMEIAFQDDSLWRAANTGSTSGTALTANVFSEAIQIALARGSGLGLVFSLAAAQIKNFKTQLKTDASPATSTFDFKSKRDTTLANFISALTTNAIPHADRS